MLALSIYLRIIAVFFLMRSWRAQAKIRCLNQPPTKRERFMGKLGKLSRRG
jgi:hypothetical protein